MQCKRFFITTFFLTFLVFFTTNRHALGVSLLNFLLTGAIPGTKFSVPYWLMFACYSLIIFGIIVQICYGKIIESRSAHAIALRRQKLPNRRYSQI